MSLEAKMDALTAALIENTAMLKSIKAGGGVEAAAPKAEKAAKADKAPKGPTVEEVKAAATAYAKQHGKPAAKALIAKHGGADLASLPAANFAAFISDSQKAPAAEEEAEDDDGL